MNDLILLRTSRAYSREERDHPWFKMIQSAILVGDPFRSWEVPAILAACGIDSQKKYLSVGAWHCSATYIIGQVAEIVALDTNPCVHSWTKEEFGIPWSRGVTISCPEKKGHIPFADDSFDTVISVSAIEHGTGTEDIDTSREIGRVLKPGGLFIFTTEFGPSFIPYDPVVGGWIYNEKALFERIIQPSGCTFINSPDFTVQVPYLQLREKELPQMEAPFCPAVIILEKE